MSRMERKLSAILAADVAGYSRLMEADEEGTLSRLMSHRQEVLDPSIARHRGRIVKTTGDGLLAEFASAVDAVRSAIEIQSGMAVRAAGVADHERIAFRIGINVGDIVEQDGDIFGDGVNIAARLEGIAEPGGICVSARVQEDVERQDRPRFRRSWRAVAEEYRASHPRLSAAARPARRRGPGQEPRVAGQAFDRRPPFPESERAAGSGLFRRRHLRGHHNRPVQAARLLRHRPELDLRLQGQDARRSPGRARAWRPLRAGGQRPQVGRAAACDRAAHRRDQRQSHLGGALRQAGHRNICGSGRDHGKRGRGDRAAALRRRGSCACRASLPKASTHGAASSAPCPTSGRGLSRTRMAASIS